MKKVWKLFKKRELYFVLIVYPICVLCAKFLGEKFNLLANTHYNYYGFLSLCISIIVVIWVLAEVFVKLHNYGLQGDKLKLRQREGIELGNRTEP